ncbi:MAG: peptidylprolyl isomerase, partial [Oscillospiraceae bacterium]|nr:peptidylprolyl isomerase [Oscillospiraceae bacterium]
LKLSGAESALIDAMIEDNILYLGGSDRSAFNRMLIDTYGFSIDRLRDILVIEQKVDKVTKYLIEGGGIGYGADELERFFMENYYRVKIVFINTTAKIKTDADGNVQTDVLGKPITEELTEEEKLGKKTVAEDVFAKAQNGADFDKLVADYSEFDNKDSYLNGYYITTYDFSSLLEAGMPKQLLLDSNSAKVGDIMMITDDASGYYIVKKEAPESGAYKSGHKDAAQLGNIVSNLLQTKYDELVDTYWDRIKTNESLLAGISITDIKRGLNIGKIS